jgi:putative DNA primase/helicase
VLLQAKRDGNTLSAALRDAWDGSDIKPAVKTKRIGVTAPHIGIHANITPGELVDLLASRDMGNGFANRFLFVWSENIGCEPFPAPTPATVIEQLADDTREIIGFAKGRYPQATNSQEIHLSASAKAYYAAIYPVLRRPLPNEFLNKFVERRLPYVLRLASLFALTDKTLVIETQHIKAALAWVNYATDTVRYVFHERANISASAETAANCRKILAFLEERPRGCTMTDIIRDCFGGHTVTAKIQDALNQLASDNPPAIEILTAKNNAQGRPCTMYRTMHSANYANK